MPWAEQLPKQCPPELAAPPNNGKFYRFISELPLKEIDFYSHRKLKPLVVFKVDECTALAVSLYNNIDAAKKMLKLPSLRGKKVLEISLPDESGVILQTGNDKNHISWWRAAGFMPTSYALVE